MRYHTVLTIAGSDSGGGAGIQADIKTISACGCYATSAITAVTVQNTLGVTAVHPVPVDVIEQQVCAVLDDIGADAIKVGMLHSADVVHCLARVLYRYGVRNVVLDPVMLSTSGHPLLAPDAVEAMKAELLPRARVITPNIPEASLLLGQTLSRQSELHDAARRLADTFHTSMLLKAGHLDAERLVDIFFDHETGLSYELPGQRVDSVNTHGTGCTLSSAFASYLALGLSLPEAATAAKRYINDAIVAGASYEIGHGHGPVHHFHPFWPSPVSK